ncbi:hypothetical protein [Planococcus rifietoensis]|uniref:hypothetical protein n=1 Tax=Planococcus rifietoensis TaxID=200991 RepID=UPI00384F77A6
MWISFESNDNFVSTYEMERAAAAKKEFERMERERPAYFKAIYKDIRLYAYRYTDYSDEAGGSPGVEAQVIEIIDRKNTYDLRIARLKERYNRWTDFLGRLDSASADILQRRFELNAWVSEPELTWACQNALKVWTKLEDEREKELDQEVWAHVVDMRERYPELFESRPTKREPEKKQYNIGGKFISMLPVEYAAYRQSELDRMNRKEGSISGL